MYLGCGSSWYIHVSGLGIETDSLVMSYRSIEYK